jgi:hypothetical protein
MPKCPDCGSTERIEKWDDSIERPLTHSFYFCYKCGMCFVAEDPQKQKEEYCREQRAAKN